MDFHDIWQENKRWILGVLAGVVVFFVGRAIISSTYDTSSFSRKITQNRRYVQEEERYLSDALTAARQEGESLEAAEERLRAALVFQPQDDFLLDGKGDPGLHFDKVNRDVRAGLLSRADQAGVELAAKDLQWPAAVGRTEIENTLVGLCLMKEAVDRLLDAHDRVRGENVEALGLVAIESLKVAAAKRSRSRGRRRVTADDSGVEEIAVDFRLRADAAVIEQFLEACRSDAARPISLRAFKMTIGRAPGEPVTVQGTLTALRVVAS